MTEPHTFSPQENPAANMQSAVNPGTINERFIAYVLDLFPFAFGWILSLWVLAHSFLWPQSLTPEKVSFLWIFVYLLYHFFGVLIGGTLGKRLMGIVVVDGNGNRPGFLQSFIRAVGQILSAPLFNFGYLIALIRADSRALDDLLSGTYVVQVRPKNKGEAAVLFLAAVSLLIFLYGFIINGIYQTPNSQDRLALKKISRCSLRGSSNGRVL